MSRPAGTIPVRLARHRAMRLARWLEAYTPPEGTVLGNAGLSATQISTRRAADLEALGAMAMLLRGRRVGRRKQPVTVYYLPRRAIELLSSGHTALSLPRSLRPIVKKMIGATERKPGPKQTEAQRRRNMRNGYYAPETVRRYRWMERKAKERAALLDRMALEVETPAMPPIGSPAWTALAIASASRWFV